MQVDFLSILRENWGYESFRGIQEDIIRSIASGHDTLGLMPTGGGKSIAFQVPALAMEGTCLVISPLIALMKDQVEHLQARGIGALMLHGEQSRDEMERILDNCIFGNYKFLYVSPERLASEFFLRKLRSMHLSFVAVDEAHCISQWGHDFRPSYLQIASVRQLHPEVPILALTATATPQTALDICHNLSRPMQEPAAHSFSIFSMSFERPNLSYIVRKAEDKFAMLVHILRSVDGSAIVYTRSRDLCREVAGRLHDEASIEALFYHAGLSYVDKEVRQQMWQRGEARVMVATNAFGMGIDKSNVRLVVHLDFPDSIEAYFQEAGRAGRDGRRAWAVLLLGDSDHRRMARRLADSFPPKDFVCSVYNELAYFFQLAVGDGEGANYEFDIQRFCRAFRRFPTQVESALRLLTADGYIDYRDDEETRSRLMFIASRDELYKLRLTAFANKVLMYVLRNYTGVFAQYVFIDESRIAHALETDYSVVYEALKSLSFQRILHYVPRKRAAYVRYLRSRVDESQFSLSRCAYDERRESMEQKMEALWRYAAGDTCRSKMLLEYFGEIQAHDCGHCDVCYDRAKHPSKVEALCRHILSVLADGEWHPLSDLTYDKASPEDRRKALNQLLAEEMVEFENGRFRKK